MTRPGPRVLLALTDGRALPAEPVAAEAGVAPSTVSEHLARLLAAGLVTVRPEGRSKFYRLASPAVADALEALARIAPERPIHSLREGSTAHALRQARTRYNHLAGRFSGWACSPGCSAAACWTAGTGGTTRTGPAVTGCLLPAGTSVTWSSPWRDSGCSGRSAWTWTRCWPTGPRGPVLPGLVRAAAPPGRAARHRAGRPAVRARLGGPDPAAPGGAGHRFRAR